MDLHEDFDVNIRLGTDLLEAASVLTDDPEQLAKYEEILKMPGVNAALFMIFKSSEHAAVHPRSLLQSAFMLGFFVHDSLDKTEQLWRDGPEEDPEYAGNQS